MTVAKPNAGASRIVPMLSENMAVVVPRSDVYYVVSEYGVVNLFGKSLEERAIAMISLAHPDYREELFSAGRELGLDLWGADVFYEGAETRPPDSEFIAGIVDLLELHSVPPHCSRGAKHP